MSIDTAGPVSIFVARVQQWTTLNLTTRTLFNKHQCLIWPQKNTTGLTDIKRRNPRNRASHLRNTEISAKCDTYLCKPGLHQHLEVLKLER